MVRRKFVGISLCRALPLLETCRAWLPSPLASPSLPADASILEAFNQATSPSFAERLFPYTMDNGIPQVREGYPAVCCKKSCSCH